MAKAPTDSIFADRLTDLPTQPGVYIMKNAEGQAIYIGKAKKLRARLWSYLHPQHAGSKVKALERTEIIHQLRQGEFERAAKLRDKLFALRKRHEKALQRPR